jgi:hypothetical protein
MQEAKEAVMLKRIIGGLLLSGSLVASAMGSEFAIRILPAGEASIERGGSIPAYCAAIFVRLEPADVEGHSYAVYDLEAWMVQELPPFYLDDFIDKEHLLSHQREVLSCAENDRGLRTEYLQRVFVLVGEDQHDLRKETVFTSYSFTDREEDRRSQRLFAVVRDYKRSNGSILSKDYQMFPYQERCVKTIDEDGSLSTKRTIETFVTWGTPQKVLMTEIRSVLYPFSEREDNRAAQRLLAVVRDYKRSNGSILSKDYQTFPYRERCAQTIEDDNALLTKRTFEFYVDRNPHIVRGKQVRETPYPYTDQSKTTERWPIERVYGQKWNIRTYTRSNGSTFSNEWKVGNEYVIRERDPWPQVRSCSVQ